jgi:hypothetical protein
MARSKLSRLSEHQVFLNSRSALPLVNEQIADMLVRVCLAWL